MSKLPHRNATLAVRSSGRGSRQQVAAEPALACSIRRRMADHPGVQFKYQQRLNACTDKPCPCGKYREREITGFRCVHEPLQEDDFAPPAAKPAMWTSVKCSSYAVSFFTSRQAVRKKMARVKTNYDVAARFGTRIVRVTVRPSDGRCSKPSQKHKHFDLHEYEHQRDWKDRIDDSFPVVENGA